MESKQQIWLSEDEIKSIFTEICWDESQHSWHIQMFKQDRTPIGVPIYVGGTRMWAEAMGAAMLKSEYRKPNAT